MDPREIAQQLRKPEGEPGIDMGDAMNKSNREMNLSVFDCLNIQPGDKVLEIGFGNGKLIPYLLKSTPNVFYAGIDYSLDMVKEARRNNKDLINDKVVEINEGNFTSIQYSDNYFNKVCTINTLYFLDDPIQGLKEVLRVLQPGGQIFMGIRPKSVANQMEFTKYGFTLYSVEEAAELLQKAGFSEVSYITKEEGEKEFKGKKIIASSSCLIGRKL